MKKPRRPELPDAVILFLYDYQKQHAGLPPTRREIAQAVKTSTSMVNLTIKKLVERGVVKLTGYADARSAQLVGGVWNLSSDTQSTSGQVAEFTVNEVVHYEH